MADEEEGCLPSPEGVERVSVPVDCRSTRNQLEKTLRESGQI